MRIHELGHVVLYVSNLTQSADFYRDILGFHEIAREQGIALFSGGRTHHELLLIEVGRTPLSPGRRTPGLYHIGFKIGNSTEELKAAHTWLLEQKVPIVGSADHTVTHSLYILDPDGNELELYADVNDTWKTYPRAVLAPVKRLDLSE